MKTIRPSTKLCIVNAHKIQDFATCQRRYYWRYIKNLDPIWMNRPYWYGSRAGAGAEALMQGKSWAVARRAMTAENKRFFQRYRVREADKEDIDIEQRIIDVLLRAFVETEEFGKISIRGNQEAFKVRLKESGIWLVGTKDGMGTYGHEAALFELKNLKRVSDNVLEDLVSDVQINTYAYSDRLAGLEPVKRCVYMIFRKTSKRVKRGQTVDDFIEEIAQDIQDRPKHYFIFKNFRLSKSQVMEVAADVEQHTLELKHKYDSLSEEEILDPHSWPRCVSACSHFAGCSYRKLCNNPARRVLYLQDFQARELRYEDEYEELAE